MKLTELSIEDCIELRHEVLWPDLPPDESRVPGDEVARHFGIVRDGTVISCLSVFCDGKDRVQIRKFATRQQLQGQGIGTLLLKAVLSKLQQEGVRSVFLDARLTAVPFYLRAGFITEGNPFVRKGVRFIRMTNKLQ
ncbi:GNAT family N-acetyltransferase [Tatumella sp. UBA2305]|uniref:GNAT family N-acetyltransferase n=1 Tax=Tatumella sp. UBA2305 TaxID=1947647 RepID=UPI0025E10E57|nr:GNAT family N-acetyltransferase [Tatumella sp. UBA2305]